MATSQNGWTVIESGTDSRLVKIPRITGRVRAGDVATVLGYLVERIDAEVEDVDVGADDWGWAYRAIRGTTSGYSNHASGTAVDVNATRHVLGKRGTFTAAQVAALRRILADLGGVVRWGGDYTGRADEMHFEIVSTAAQVAAVAARIRVGALVSNPITAGGSTPTVPNLNAPTPIEEDDLPSIKEVTDAIYSMPVADRADGSKLTLGQALAMLPELDRRTQALLAVPVAMDSRERTIRQQVAETPVIDRADGSKVLLWQAVALAASGTTAITAKDIAAAIPPDLAQQVVAELGKTIIKGA